MANNLQLPMIDFSNQSALDWLQAGAILLDIRTREEFCKGHIQGAILIPTSLPPLTQREVNILRDQLWWTLPQYLSSHKAPIVVYCRKGKRAVLSKKIIQELGYPHVIAWGGVDESPLRQLFETQNSSQKSFNRKGDLKGAIPPSKLQICTCQPGRLKTKCQSSYQSS